MMTELEDLYQELILDHNRRPRNRRALDTPDRKAEGYNPLCGDKITVFVKLKDDMVEEVTFEGSGCAISTASASLMTESLKGKSIAEARALFKRFHAMLIGESSGNEYASGMGKLDAFSGVNRFPARVKCATLAWHTVKAALDDDGKVVTTE